MLIAFDNSTLNVIFIHPTAIEMTEELLGIVGDREYGTILSDIPFEEYTKPGSSHRVIEVDGIATFEFTPAPEPDHPEKTPDQVKIEELEANNLTLMEAVFDLYAMIASK